MLRALPCLCLVLLFLSAPARAQEDGLTELPPPGSALLRSAELRDGDPVHRGSGTAKLLRLADGNHVLRLEDLEVVPGPDLYVYLAEHEDPLFPEDVTAGFASLGNLKSRLGDQNYPLPEGIDPAKYGSIVIWCDRFNLQFAVGALR